jgi:Pro-kumamolisin, activation domain
VGPQGPVWVSKGAWDSETGYIAGDVVIYADQLWQALADLTSFGRSLIDDADAATARTTLGLAARAVLATVDLISLVTANSFPMEHMLIHLQRPATEEAALRQLIDQLHDPSSPNFHRWLTPEQLGAQYGPAASDIQQVTQWLQGWVHGVGEDGVPGFTAYGIECLEEIIAIERAAGGAPPKVSPPK